VRGIVLANVAFVVCLEPRVRSGTSLSASRDVLGRLLLASLSASSSLASLGGLVNDLLRRALADAHVTEAELAALVRVDPKTVHRWLAGRVPYARHRDRVAALLGRDEADLWPQLAASVVRTDPPVVEVLATYPHRWAVPRPVWQQLFQRAGDEIGILAYAGLFLAEDTGILRAVAERARAGVRVRILLGDPDGTCVAERGSDEGVGESMAAKIRNALVHYRALGEVDGVEMRLHDTVLYNSIYRADDDLLINPHAYGIAASHAPVLHLRRTEDGDMASTYVESFERVWSDGKTTSRSVDRVRPVPAKEATSSHDLGMT
jgi:hypothetical protein